MAERQLPPGYPAWMNGTKLAQMPAAVIWSPSGDECVVCHPFGAHHPAFVSTVQRLRRQGVRIVACPPLRAGDL